MSFFFLEFQDFSPECSRGQIAVATDEFWCFGCSTFFDSFPKYRADRPIDNQARSRLIKMRISFSCWRRNRFDFSSIPLADPACIRAACASLFHLLLVYHGNEILDKFSSFFFTIKKKLLINEENYKFKKN